MPIMACFFLVFNLFAHYRLFLEKADHRWLILGLILKLELVV